MAGCISKAVAAAAGALLLSEKRGGGIIDPDPPNLQKDEKDLTCKFILGSFCQVSIYFPTLSKLS